MAIVTASVGVILLGIGCAGYLFRPLSWAKRGLLWVASLLLLIPSWSGVWLMIDDCRFCPWSHRRLWEWNRSARAQSRLSLRRTAAARNEILLVAKNTSVGVKN